MGETQRMLTWLFVCLVFIGYSNIAEGGRRSDSTKTPWRQNGAITDTKRNNDNNVCNHGEGCHPCLCYSKTKRAVCQNVTIIPKLPNCIDKVEITCHWCFNETLNSQVFQNIISLNLKSLKIRDSHIRYIHGDTFANFKNLPALEELDLSGNKMSEIPMLCSDTVKFPGLKDLSLHKNSLAIMDAEPLNCFRNLTSLNLGKNRMKTLTFSVFEKLTKLVHLDLHSNWFSNVTDLGNGMPTLKSLNLHQNQFALFPPRLCGYPSMHIKPFLSLKNLNLAQNLITIPYSDSWNCMTNLTILNLTRNPIRRLLNDTFSQLVNLETLLISEVVLSIDEIQPRALKNSHMKLLNMSNNGLKFDDPDIPWSMFSYSDSVTSLDLSGNVLDLHRNVHERHGRSIATLLAPMKGLEQLYLQRCQLNTLPANLTGALLNLKQLFLDSNMINVTNIDDTYIESELHYLSLTNNKIHTIAFRGLNNTLNVDLSNNPFDCGCHMLSQELRQEITEDQNKTAHIGSITLINWPSGYKCESPPNWKGKLLRNFHPATDCKSTDPDYLMFAFIILTCFLFVFSVITAVIYKNIWYIKYWIYKLKKKPGRRQWGDNDPRQPLLDSDDVITRDAFVINHVNDDIFVLTDLQAVLENQMGYNLCIYERNCVSGAKLDLLIDGIYSCKYTLAVVSKSLLRDPWCQFQLDVAFDRRIREKRPSLILVLLDDFDFQSLNKYWCIMLTKSPTAHWCPTQEDIKRKLFNQQIQTHLGVPAGQPRQRLQRSVSLPPPCLNNPM